MTPARPRNPIVPADSGDRTGSAGIRRRAGAVIRRRWEALRRDALALFAGIRVYRVNDGQGGVVLEQGADRTVYALTAAELALLSLQLQRLVGNWIASDSDVDSTAWWDSLESEAMQAGTAQSVANLAGLSAVYAAARTLQQAIFSDAYRERLAALQFRSRQQWTAMGSALRAEVAQIIGRAVVDGTAPQQVRTQIAERVQVSQARALVYAVSALTDAVREARQAEADYAEETFGIALALLWTSALTPTTRTWHASRHGQVYNSDQVRAFYAQQGNRYNCRCSTTEVLLDAGRRPLVTDALRKAMAKERAAWERGRRR